MKMELPANTFTARRTGLRFPGWKRAVATLTGLLLLQAVPDARAVGYVFSISSTTPWTDTGLDVLAGTELLITATGMVQYGPFAQQITDANGGDYTGTKFFSDAVLSNTVVVSLIGKIGGTTTIGTGAPIPEGVPGNGIGFVGTSYDQVMPTSGRLFLGFNDRIGYFGDNSGSFAVTVTVVPEPSVLALFAVGGLGFFGRRMLRRSRKEIAR